MRVNIKDNKLKCIYNGQMVSIDRFHKLFILDAGPKDTDISLRLSRKQWADIKKHCKKTGISQSSFIRLSILAKLESSSPHKFQNPAYRFSEESLESPRSIAINSKLKKAIDLILSEIDWEFQSYARLALAERTGEFLYL